EGFVAQAPNLLKPPRAFDPRPYAIVVLEGGPVAEEDRKPPREPVRYRVIDEAFEAPVLPFVTGSNIEIRNDGTGEPRVFAPARPDLITGEPIKPRRASVIKKLALSGQALELRGRDS